LFVWSRFGSSSSADSPEVQQHKFIRHNLVIVAVAEILMTMPQAGIPLLFATRIQHIICTERRLPCSNISVFPSQSVIADSNVYTSYLSSAVGASNFLGTLLIGSVSDIVGRRACILVVAFGLLADSIICMLCGDLQVGFVLLHASMCRFFPIIGCSCFSSLESL
jgi:MFS family permease